MADVEDPARVVAQRARHGLLDIWPRDDLRIDRLLEQPRVEEARCAVGFAVHRDQSDHARRWIQRLRERPAVAGAVGDPSRFRPTSQFAAESMHRAWINTEGLPEKRTDEHRLLVDKWIEATGKFPG